MVMTEEIIKKAESYIPLNEKVAIAEIIAQECVMPVEVSVQKLESDSVLALPQQYTENLVVKNLHLMRVFLTMYLKIAVPEPFTIDDYNKYAKAHIMNQMERYKCVPYLKDKVFDILADYKELKKLVDTEIYNIKCVYNDPLERLLAGIGLMATPEAMKALAEQLQKVEPPKELADKMAERDKARKSADEANTKAKQTAKEQADKEAAIKLAEAAIELNKKRKERNGNKDNKDSNGNTDGGGNKKPQE